MRCASAVPVMMTIGQVCIWVHRPQAVPLPVYQSMPADRVARRVLLLEVHVRACKLSREPREQHSHLWCL